MSITASNINKTFGDYRALIDVNLEVPEGKLVSLLGPSGSGKTTLLRILAGLEFPDDDGGGSVSFHGVDVTRTTAGKRGVGFVFQHYALFRHMTVENNVSFGLRARPARQRPDKAAIKARVRELLQLVQLDGLQQRYPSELSGGQRQRVALARALAVEPKVLLLDEPFGALDARVRKDLRWWLRKFQEEIGITTVFVTHDQEEALELADSVVVMNNARIEQVGDPQTVYDRPASPFVYEFLGDVNRIDGLGPAGVPLYIRPHEIRLCFAAEAPVARSARVLHLFAAGPTARVTLKLDGSDRPLTVDATREQVDDMALQPGDVVGVQWPGQIERAAPPVS